MLVIMFIGYFIIGVYIGADVRRVLKRCRVEFRPCFGRRTIYLRERKTGRLIGCSNNLFTLILQVA
ncbi:hypothetical protein [Klebsiella pneumoniae]|uniref:hypothetical protein n=1 Tax=Klebsiella pneumoniae TaxID=573 RepID=UPI0025A0405F|nr:hypothetical protein [Klebsiella pneumoniae]